MRTSRAIQPCACVLPSVQKTLRKSLIWMLLFVSGPLPVSFAQNAAPEVTSRITQRIDENQLMRLKGNTYPLALPQYDRGAAPAGLPMERMLLVLKRSPGQETALATLLGSQQDKSSPNYHKWLTPEQFGQQFGPADQDIQTISAWLQSHGFQVNQVAKGRMMIEFSGDAAQVQQAFHTTIHKYVVKGEEHWANSSDPQIPVALAPVVAGVNTLHNFPRQPLYHAEGVMSRSKKTGKLTPLQPQTTFPTPANQGCGVQASDCYGVGPYDFATIYNVLPLWTASPAINGTGVTIAVIGETDVNPQDISDFRNFFGLPALGSPGPVLNVIHNGPDPGILLDGEETESDLDLQWTGGVAPGANLDFVVSEATETTLGVDLSAAYVIDNDIAPIMSESYGICELGLGNAGNLFFSQLWQQAAAEGITVILASGDSGSAGCDSHGAIPPAPAQFGLQVSGFASTPYNVAVGGTDFDDLTNSQLYWSQTNAATTQLSALSYIPETTWNDSCTNSVFGDLLGFSSNAEANCNNSQLIDNFVLTVGGSGGASNCTTNDGQHPSSCANGYPKPSWQSALTPNDGVRDIPDVSLYAASGSPSGSFILICEADLIPPGDGSSCQPNDPNGTNLFGVGGTSGSAPAFAGIMALVNQKTASPQGNANYVLYNLAGQETFSACNSSTGPGSTCVFNDVTTGTIAMPCANGSPNCTVTNPADQYGVLSGYNTGVGYDLATGLGSINAANLVTQWASATTTPTTATLALNSGSAVSVTHGQSVSVNVGVAPSSGTGTPSGTVALEGNPSSGQIGLDSRALTNGSAAWSTTLLPGGSYNVTAHYPGDGTFGPSSSSAVAVHVAPENSVSVVRLLTFDLAGNLSNPNATTAPYGSFYFVRADVENSAGAMCAPSSSTGQIPFSCPTGSVDIKANGGALDAGIFPLNNLGYAEDQPVDLNAGSYTLVASYAGDASFNASTSAADSITITQTPTTTTLTPINGTPNPGTPVPLTAGIGAVSFGNPPTGMVTFFSGSTNLGAAPVTSPGATTLSIATLMTSQLPTGADSVTAQYSGDTNYLASTAPAITVNVQPDFLIAASAPSLTLKAGQSGMLTLTITGQTGYNGTVNFSASSCLGLPLKSSCSFSQGSVTGNGSTTVTVTTTAAQTSALRTSRRDFLALLLASGAGSVVGIFFVGGGKTRRWKIMLGLIVVALLLGAAVGCGGGSSGGGSTTIPGTPPGTYNVTINATDGFFTNPVSFGLVVQ